MRYSCGAGVLWWFLIIYDFIIYDFIINDLKFLYYEWIWI